MTLDIGGGTAAVIVLAVFGAYMCFSDWMEHCERMAGVSEAEQRLSAIQEEVYDLDNYVQEMEVEAAQQLAAVEVRTRSVASDFVKLHMHGVASDFVKLQTQIESLPRMKEHMASMSGEMIDVAQTLTSLDARIKVTRAIVDNQVKEIDALKGTQHVHG